MSDVAESAVTPTVACSTAFRAHGFESIQFRDRKGEVTKIGGLVGASITYHAVLGSGGIEPQSITVIESLDPKLIDRLPVGLHGSRRIRSRTIPSW